MEDGRRDSKTKKSRSEHVKQVVLSFMQKRNYPTSQFIRELNLQDFKLSARIMSEIGRPNSILYSCLNNDPVAIDQSFVKFVAWLKDLTKNRIEREDLEYLIGPLFCHLYIEILRGGHSDRANTFFKNHLSAVDKLKCDRFVQDLINAFTNDGIDWFSLKEYFRCHKYVVRLSGESIKVLKDFLATCGHIVLLHVFQNWFTIEETDDKQEYEFEEFEEAQQRSEQIKNICNGHSDQLQTQFKNDNDSEISMQKLMDVIENVKNESPNIFSINLSNAKEEISCGFLYRRKALLAYSYDSSIFLRPLNTLEQLGNTVDYGEATLSGHMSRIYDMSVFNKHPSLLLSCSHDKTIRLFDIDNYTEKGTYRGHEYPIYCLATSTIGVDFVSGSYDRSAQLWNLERLHPLRLFVGHTQQVTCIDYHKNDMYVATGSADKTIRMWNVSDGEPIRLLLGSKGVIYSVKFSPQGKYLASVGDDKRLRIWDLVSSKQLFEFKVSMQPVTKVAFSDNEKYIATGSIDGVVNVWDFKKFLENSSETSSNILPSPVVSVAYTPKLLSLDYCFDTFGCFSAQKSDIN